MAANKNTLAVNGDSLSTSLKPAHVRKLTRFSQTTGYPLSEVLDRGIELFMRQEAPVYVAQAKPARSQSV